MNKDSLWEAFGHIVTAAVKHGEKQPSGNGDRRGGSAAGGAPGFGDAGSLRIKVGPAKKPCCIAKRPGQK
jgi:hypothetical protein